MWRRARGGRRIEARSQVERELRDNVHIALVVRDARGGLDPKLRVYDLRHTNISVRLAAGEQLLTVSKSVGHKSAKMTLDVYGHAFKSDRRSTVVLDKVIELWKVG